MLQYVGDNARTFQTQLRQRLGGVDRRDPARPARARAAGRRQVLRRADARTSTTCCRPTAGRGDVNILAADQLMQSPEALLDVAAVAAGRAVRAAARGRRPRQAEARVLLRRGAPAVHRRAEGAAREDRAGRAADPLQGRRRVLRHAESARRAGHRARPARQSRPARAARVHAARPEGGEGGGGDDARQSQARHREGDHRARRRRRRWSRSSTRRAVRASSSAPSCCRRRRASVRSRPTSGSAIMAASPVAGVYDKTVDRESAYEKLKGRAAATRRPPRPPGTAPARAAASGTRSRTRSAA